MVTLSALNVVGRLPKGCPSCSQPIGKIRCLAIEKVLESVQVSCKHALQGCKEMLKYSVREVHENLCEYGTYHCPVSDCKHVNSKASMHNHFVIMHHGWNGVLDPSTRSAKFFMAKSWNSVLVIVKTGEGLILVHSEKEGSSGATFSCTSFGASKVFCNLKVKLRGGSTSSFVMET